MKIFKSLQKLEGSIGLLFYFFSKERGVEVGQFKLGVTVVSAAVTDLIPLSTSSSRIPCQGPVSSPREGPILHPQSKH